MAYRSRNGQRTSGFLSLVGAQFWFKCFGTMGFTAVFFGAYIYLLRNPAAQVVTMPVTAIDRFIGFEPGALPIYLSLWIYVSLPPVLMPTRREIVEYGVWIGGLCLVALTIFYVWPNAVPPANIDWSIYPGVAFLKGVDAAGNACPSLHVATAVFSACWLHWLLPAAGIGRGGRLASAVWCAAIAYSTLATKQHVAVDVLAGGALGFVVAWLSKPERVIARRPATQRPARTPAGECLLVTAQPHHQRSEKQHDENEEQDPGNLDRAGGDAGKAEQRGNQRNNQETEGVIKHFRPLL